MAVYKKQEFKAFIKALKFGSMAHWIDIARALNVEENTITKWKQLPEAQQAIQDGIDQAFAAMEQAGKKDWRMWEAKLKMFGINPVQKIEFSDPREDLLKQYMGNSNARKAKDTEGRSSSDPA